MVAAPSLGAATRTDTRLLLLGKPSSQDLPDRVVMTQCGCSLNLLCTSIDYQMRNFCAPELAYEKVEDNVRREVEKLGLSYLVVLDND